MSKKPVSKRGGASRPTKPRKKSSTKPSLGEDLLFRRAWPADVSQICKIVNYWAERGIMLPRSTEEVLNTLPDFSVIEKKGKVIACGARASYGPELAEFRSIAVSHKEQKHGVGRVLIEKLIQETQEDRIPKVFVFTYVLGFFEKLGFHIVAPESLPQKAWKDCWRCPKREGCDEIAMVRMIP